MDLLSKGTAALRESVERGVEAVRSAPFLAQTYEIGERRYTLRKQVAQGGFATVFAARDDRGAEWAVKRMLLHRAEARKARTEVALLKPLQHPHVVHLEAAAMWTRPTGEVEVALILDWCAGGSLAEHLWARRLAPLAWDEVVAIAEQLAAAVAYLHALKPPVAHRDVKAENLLLHASGAWKLCDFGSATTAVLGPAASEAERAALELEVSQSTTEMLRAPEQVDLYRGHAIGPPVDLWAVGCVLFQLAAGRLPFDQRLGILNGAYRLPDDARHPPALAALLRDLLHQDPARRMTAPALLRRLAAIKAGNTAAWAPDAAPAAPTAPAPAAPAPAATPAATPAPAPAPAAKAPSKADLFAALDWVPSSSSAPAPAPTPASAAAPAASAGAAPSDPFASLDWMAAPAAKPPALAASASSGALFDPFDAPAAAAAAKPAAGGSGLFDLTFAQAPSPTPIAPTRPAPDSAADLFAAFAAPPPAPASPSLSRSSSTSSAAAAPSQGPGLDLFAALNNSASTAPVAPAPVRKLSGDPFGLAPVPRPPPSSASAPVTPAASSADLFAFDAFAAPPAKPPTPTPSPSASPLSASFTAPSPPAPAPAAPTLSRSASSLSATAPAPPAFPLLDNTPASLPAEQIRVLLSELAFLRDKVQRLEAAQRK